MSTQRRICGASMLHDYVAESGYRDQPWDMQRGLERFEGCVGLSTIWQLCGCEPHLFIQPTGECLLLYIVMPLPLPTSSACLGSLHAGSWMFWRACFENKCYSSRGYGWILGSSAGRRRRGGCCGAASYPPPLGTALVWNDHTRRVPFGKKKQECSF